MNSIVNNNSLFIVLSRNVFEVTDSENAYVPLTDAFKAIDLFEKAEKTEGGNKSSIIVNSFKYEVKAFKPSRITDVYKAIYLYKETPAEIKTLVNQLVIQVDDRFFYDKISAKKEANTNLEYSCFYKVEQKLRNNSDFKDILNVFLLKQGQFETIKKQFCDVNKMGFVSYQDCIGGQGRQFDCVKNLKIQSDYAFAHLDLVTILELIRSDKMDQNKLFYNLIAYYNDKQMLNYSLEDGIDFFLKNGFKPTEAEIDLLIEKAYMIRSNHLIKAIQIFMDQQIKLPEDKIYISVKKFHSTRLFDFIEFLLNKKFEKKRLVINAAYNKHISKIEDCQKLFNLCDNSKERLAVFEGIISNGNVVNIKFCSWVLDSVKNSEERDGISKLILTNSDICYSEKSFKILVSNVLESFKPDIDLLEGEIKKKRPDWILELLINCVLPHIESESEMSHFSNNDCYSSNRELFCLALKSNCSLKIIKMIHDKGINCNLDQLKKIIIKSKKYKKKDELINELITVKDRMTIDDEDVVIVEQRTIGKRRADDLEEKSKSQKLDQSP